MHELSVASGIVDRALAAAEEHDADRIEEFTVAVGEATHLNPEQLRFCLETASEGTIATEATVTIEPVSPVNRCGCGWRGEPEPLDSAIAYAPDVRCPECGDRTEFERGRECRLASIEIPDQ